MFSHARMFSAAQLFSAFRTAGLPILSRLGGVPQGERGGGGRGGLPPPTIFTGQLSYTVIPIPSVPDTLCYGILVVSCYAFTNDNCSECSEWVQVRVRVPAQGSRCWAGAVRQDSWGARVLPEVVGTLGQAVPVGWAGAGADSQPVRVRADEEGMGGAAHLGGVRGAG